MSQEVVAVTQAIEVASTTLVTAQLARLEMGQLDVAMGQVNHEALVFAKGMGQRARPTAQVSVPPARVVRVHDDAGGCSRLRFPSVEHVRMVLQPSSPIASKGPSPGISTRTWGTSSKIN